MSDKGGPHQLLYCIAQVMPPVVSIRCKGLGSTEEMQQSKSLTSKAFGDKSSTPSPAALE